MSIIERMISEGVKSLIYNPNEQENVWQGFGKPSVGTSREEVNDLIALGKLLRQGNKVVIHPMAQNLNMESIETMRVNKPKASYDPSVHATRLLRHMRLSAGWHIPTTAGDRYAMAELFKNGYVIRSEVNTPAGRAIGFSISSAGLKACR